MQGFLNRINKTMEHGWDKYAAEFPGFFYRDRNTGAKNMPAVIPARTMLNLPDFPTYARRYVDQDPTSYYFLMNGSPLAGPVDRDTAVRLFHKIFHDDLGMHSSYEDEGYDDKTAADMEVLPAALDKNYKTFYDQQMEALAKAFAGAGDEDGSIDVYGDVKDAADDDVIDVVPDADDPNRFVPAGSGDGAKGAVQAAPKYGVAAPKKIWYGVDLRVPANYELGYDGRGRGGRLDGRRAPGGFLREENGLSQLDSDDIAEMFLDYGQRNGVAVASGDVRRQGRERALTRDQERGYASGKAYGPRPYDRLFSEYEPEADGSEYYGETMAKAAAIADDEAADPLDESLDESLVQASVELERKLR